MIRSSSRSEPKHAAGVTLLLAAVLAGGCASSSESLRFETASSIDDSEPRRPAGVAVDPAPELPPAASAASAEHGLVVLKTPLDKEAARQVVRDFFRAVLAADSERLEKLFDEQAYIQAGPAAGRQQAVPFWKSRLSRLDYGALAGQVVVRDAELEVYRTEDLARMKPARTFALSPQVEDVVVRAPIATPRSGRTRLFGDEITFLLRPDGSGFEIV